MGGQVAAGCIAAIFVLWLGLVSAGSGPDSAAATTTATAAAAGAAGIASQVPIPLPPRDAEAARRRIRELEAQLVELRGGLQRCTLDRATPPPRAVGPGPFLAQQQLVPLRAGTVTHAYASTDRDEGTSGGGDDDDDDDDDVAALAPRRRLGHDKDDAEPVIGICLASTSKSMKHSKEGLAGIPLFTVLLPSLAHTMEAGFSYRVYVGVDTGDAFFDNDANEEAILDWFDEHVGAPARALGVEASLKILLFVNENHKPGPAFNHACKAAFDEGADYMYRVNDDSRFVTTFAKRLVAELANRCPPNIGVTGPSCREGNTHILTHDFTHRHHMEIFHKQYYPVELTDWWLDDWVTHVYGTEHTSVVLDVVVKHQTDAAGTRYNVNHEAKKALKQLQIDANSAIREYVGRTFPGLHCAEPVGLVSTTLRVSVHPELVTMLQGVRGLHLDVSAGADRVPAVATELECSHHCWVHPECAGYTWRSPPEETMHGAAGVLSVLKSILGVGSAANDQSGSSGNSNARDGCFLFFAEQAAVVAGADVDPQSISGGRVEPARFHGDDGGEGAGSLASFPPRIAALLRLIDDPEDAAHYSSQATRVSFGGGDAAAVPGWQVDAGKPLQGGSEPGAFGWNCDLQAETQHRRHEGFTDVHNHLQFLARASGSSCPAPKWTLRVPNGDYRVVVGYADTEEVVLAEGCRLNGEAAHDGKHTSGTNFAYSLFVRVAAGVLEFEGRYDRACTSIAYIIVDHATMYFANVADITAAGQLPEGDGEGEDGGEEVEGASGQ